MTADTARRGIELVDAGRVLARPGWFARVWTGPVSRVLDRIDAGLASGAIDAVLPDGSQRRLGGRAPGFVARVELRSWRALLRLATGGSAGWYQAWEAGEWDSPDPVPLFALFMANGKTLGDAGRAHGPWRLMARALHFLHRNTRSGARRNIHAHYDLGNDFYALWLDPAMVYSSARFAPGAQDLAAAQQTKLETIAARVKGASSVLEIGCGWGALAQHLHQQGAAVTAISLSDEQLAWARGAQSAGIDFRKQDYRDVTGEFDAVVSVEMVEAVGREYWGDWFDCIARCLKPGGRAAIQFISIREDLFPAYARSADFIQTHVFPGGMLVSEAEFERLAAARGLSWEDREGFALDYAETLRLWREAFDRVVAEGRLPASFDDRFVRLWRFYLMYCEGGFRGGGIDVAQVTLVKR
ncbi:cyclopropane-fatty-acyl-phospholipid synthase family protein [Novosphingobium sp.]|uniref:SAM-dependent methyltransferase n=1 Tax=Novosphingobium sp. TaxID=1874826 RepID=UPI001ECFB81A|nr:cyclopropane-fatty-acyl-phospholipid synthase family protein [Novosphingobium sp.]MBK6801797.1 class I SAM-dependent methyltransferase [Novosphingobium sp.]MBK9010360.1 class I SAM-dependent methyltransferase [Novosphingobium sp.]